MNPHDEQKLERLIHETLRSLPPRRAPHSLESRVLAAIEQRQELPWWKLGFVHWPVSARVAFVIASAGLVKIAFMATVWVMAGFDTGQFRALFATQFGWLQTGLTVARALGDFLSVAFHSIPPLWLYGGAAIVATLYVALFGLGAAAYRTLYVNR